MIVAAVIIYVGIMAFVIGACMAAGDADEMDDRIIGDLPHLPEDMK